MTKRSSNSRRYARAHAQPRPRLALTRLATVSDHGRPALSWPLSVTAPSATPWHRPSTTTRAPALRSGSRPGTTLGTPARLPRGLPQRVRQRGAAAGLDLRQKPDGPGALRIRRLDPTALGLRRLFHGVSESVNGEAILRRQRVDEAAEGAAGGGHF